MPDSVDTFDLPGFRFHPTEEELLDFYLKNVVSGRKLGSDIIGFVSIYKYDPWELPGLAKVGEREWYFFVPRDWKHGSGGRPNRTTENGFWKATGSDRKIVSLSEPKRFLGMRKTLVFYSGRAPKGCRTDWVMNEYRLPDSCSLPKDIVLCKIYRKATSLKVLEQRAAMEEEKKAFAATTPSSSSPPCSMDTMSICSHQQEYTSAQISIPQVVLKKEIKPETTNNEDEHLKQIKGCSLHLPIGNDNLPELQLPSLNLDWNWNHCNFWFNSPSWFQNLASPANFLNLID